MRGFLLLELLLTLAILGLLGVVALPRLVPPGSAAADRETALQVLGLARQAAIASQCPVVVTLKSTGLTVNSAAQDAETPGGEAPAHCPAVGTPIAGLARSWPSTGPARTTPTTTVRFDTDGSSPNAAPVVFGPRHVLLIDARSGHVTRD